jgi:hypothetical protein
VARYSIHSTGKAADVGKVLLANRCAGAGPSEHEADASRPRVARYNVTELLKACRRDAFILFSKFNFFFKYEGIRERNQIINLFNLFIQFIFILTFIYFLIKAIERVYGRVVDFSQRPCVFTV